MSKIERAQITLNLSKVSIPKLLDQLSVMILSQAEEAGLTLSIRAEGVNHEDFYGDPLRINQILINLLSNAVKFANKGGMVELLAEEVETEGSAGRVSSYIKNAEPSFSLSSGKRAFSGCCFLVAEDNAINAEILCELLGLCGAETVLMTDGAKAVKAFQDTEPETYDAILMDIQMPKMNGYDAARAIRGMEREDAVQNAFQAGMNAHIAKPIDLNVLMNTLQKVLDESGKELETSGEQKRRK